MVPKTVNPLLNHGFLRGVYIIFAGTDSAKLPLAPHLAGVGWDLPVL